MRPFFSAIKQEFSRQLDERKMGYTWESTGYGLWPSTHIYSLGQCPRETIQVKVHEAPSFGIDTKYSFAYGSALHHVYQDAARSAAGLLYKAPHMPEELISKANWIFPEVPVRDPASGLSGQADLVLSLDNEPVPMELKTTASDPTKWLEDRKKKPNSNHKVQVALYAHIMNREGYYDKKIKKCGTGYINFLHGRPGYFENEHEVYFDFTNEMDEKCGELLKQLAFHRDAYMAGEDIPCEYEYCNRHKKGRR